MPTWPTLGDPDWARGQAHNGRYWEAFRSHCDVCVNKEAFGSGMWNRPALSVSLSLLFTPARLFYKLMREKIKFLKLISPKATLTWYNTLLKHNVIFAICFIHNLLQTFVILYFNSSTHQDLASKVETAHTGNHSHSDGKQWQFRVWYIKKGLQGWGSDHYRPIRKHLLNINICFKTAVSNVSAASIPNILPFVRVNRS